MSEQLPGHVDDPVMSHSESIEIDAPPEKVWEMVTALDRYGEWSNENTGGYWRKGPDGVPGTGQVGDMFVGINRLDGEEWKAPVEIIRRADNEDFAFVTGGRRGLAPLEPAVQPGMPIICAVACMFTRPSKSTNSLKPSSVMVAR